MSNLVTNEMSRDMLIKALQNERARLEEKFYATNLALDNLIKGTSAEYVIAMDAPKIKEDIKISVPPDPPAITK